MSNKKILLSIAVIILVLSACSTGKNTGGQNSTGQNNPYPASQSTPSSANNTNPYPIASATQVISNSAYPNPGSVSSASNLPSQYLVDNLSVPSPSDSKGVVTGQLLLGGDTSKPYITSLYLASTTPASDPNQPPVVNFSITTDPIATFEKSSGRFMFDAVAPGRYALVVSTGSESYFISDSSGKTLIVEVKANKVSDLGVIPIK